MIIKPLIFLYTYYIIHYCNMQHVQLNLNLTGGRMASDAKQAQAAAVQAAPGLAAAAIQPVAVLLEEEEDDQQCREKLVQVHVEK
jgi:hypothetical protein